jgi:hypothetical protein
MIIEIRIKIRMQVLASGLFKQDLANMTYLWVVLKNYFFHFSIGWVVKKVYRKVKPAYTTNIA